MEQHQSTLLVYNLSYHIEQPAGTVTLFDMVNWQVQPGDVHIIQGVSGSGKSTFLSLLAGLQRPTQGSVHYGITALSLEIPEHRTELHSKFIGIVFQQPFLIPELTVRENVMIKGLIRGDSYDDCVQQACHLLTLVGLEQYDHRTVNQLSGGEQQRVAIARALYGNPQILLLDEPTAHLDTTTKHTILRVLENVCTEYTTSIVMTSHDQDISLPQARVWHINNKTLIQQ